MGAATLFLRHPALCVARYGGIRDPQWEKEVESAQNQELPYQQLNLAGHGLNLFARNTLRSVQNAIEPTE